MRQLLPHPLDPVEPAAIADDLPSAAGRPSVRLNMVTSVDGATALSGRSGGLGGPGDRRLFAALRARADVILVAAGTVRAERYRPASMTDDEAAQRSSRGQGEAPPIAVVSASCRLDWDSPFFTAAVARPLVVTVESAAPEDRSAAARVADVVVAGDDAVALPIALAALAARGASTVLAEGGPTLNGQLAATGVLDELCLTLSPRLVGGGAARLLGATELVVPEHLALRSLCEEDGSVFLRYRRAVLGAG